MITTHFILTTLIAPENFWAQIIINYAKILYKSPENSFCKQDVYVSAFDYENKTIGKQFGSPAR